MHSVKGSAWLNLSFDFNKEQLQAIDEYGMTNLSESNSKNDANLADFLITVRTSENRIVLKGLRGTAWTDLSFTLKNNKRQKIDQFGMSEIN